MQASSLMNRCFTCRASITVHRIGDALHDDSQFFRRHASSGIDQNRLALLDRYLTIRRVSVRDDRRVMPRNLSIGKRRTCAWQSLELARQVDVPARSAVRQPALGAQRGLRTHVAVGTPLARAAV